MIENILIHIFITLFFLLLLICLGLVAFSARRAFNATKIPAPPILTFIFLFVFILILSGIILEAYLLFR